MTQSAARTNTDSRQSLPGLPDQPLTSEQHLDAIRCVQDRADKRVKLGTQLFKAAEAHTNHYKQILGDIKTEQQSLRDQVDTDVANSLQSYDKWIGDIDEGFGDAMSQLENKINRLQDDWQKTQARIESMMDRSQQMLSKSKSAIAQTEKTLDLQTKTVEGEVHKATTQAKKSAEFVTTSHQNENMLAKVEPQAAATPAPEITPADTTPGITPYEKNNTPTIEPDDNDEECGEGVTDAKLTTPTPTAPDNVSATDQNATDAKTDDDEQPEEPQIKIYTQLLDKLLNQYDKTAGD